MSTRRRILLFTTLLLLTSTVQGMDPLEQEFNAPPESARPHTWWHWMSGNLSKEGISADLEYFKRTGVGGVQLFNIKHSIPAGNVSFMSEEWLDCFAHAVQEADRLGLKFAMHNSPGWSGSGGPWVQPEDAMKKLTWSITNVSGSSRRVKSKAASNSGNIQYASYNRLSQSFLNPSGSSRPMVYWFWMSGNISKEGITADLEYMKQSGIAGALIYDIKHSIPVGPVHHMSEEWLDYFVHAVEEADRLGLELGMHNSPGWTGSGGPWVQPEDAMKKITWTTTQVESGQKPIKLQKPTALKISGNALGKVFKSFSTYGNSVYSPEDDYWYRDIAVLAWKNRETIVPFADAAVQIKSKLDGFDGNKLLDKDPLTQVKIPWSAKEDKPEMVIAFEQPFKAASLTLFTSPQQRSLGCRIEVSDDGRNYRAIKSSARFEEKLGNQPLFSCSFEPVRAKYFKVVFDRLARGNQIIVADVELSPDYLLPGWPQKAGYGRGNLETVSNINAVPEGLCIPKEGVINLTQQLQPDGTLEWQVPEGDWRILRIGYALSGWLSKPAPDGGKGLEVDKLSRASLERFFNDGVCRATIEKVGPHAGKAYHALVTDSYEPGSQNWTAGLEQTFEERFGYSIMPFLPALTGRIVESAEVTERFLFDFRRLLADQFAENYYGYLRELANRHGLKLYAETYGHGNFDNLQCASLVDVPMDEFWGGGLQLGGLASAVHTSGKKILAAEAFTTARDTKAYHPATLKVLGDRAFCAGINRFIFHASAHQPWTAPGVEMTMMGCGINFRRNITWADQAYGWVDYLSRCQHLLQQGQFVADVLRFVGEGAPAGTLVPWALHDEGRRIQGCSWDACTAETVLSLSVNKGRLVLPSGMSYRMLVLPETTAMSEQLLKKIKALVEQGATVSVGNRPVSATGLQNYPHSDRVVQQIGNELWGNLDGVERKQRSFGKGRLFCGMTIPEALDAANVLPDVQETDPGIMPLEWIHRYVETEDTHLYFVANPSKQTMSQEVLFRVAGYVPEFWNPMDGSRIQAPVYREENGRTSVLLNLDPEASVFVVFRRSRPQPHLESFAHDAGTYRFAKDEIHLFENAPKPVAVDGTWNVSFSSHPGQPDPIVLKKLISWPEHSDELVKYFSGTGIYATTFDVPNELFTKNIALYLDLGRVHEMVEIRVNGKDAGLIWIAPFKLDVTSLLKPGKNTLEVRVTNLPVNRQIGNAQYPDDCDFGPDGLLSVHKLPDWLPDLSKRPEPRRVSFSTWRHWGKDDPLRPSGLLGPVRIVPAVVKKVP